MKMTKQEEKLFLREKYADYNPKRHDAFIIRYRKEVEGENLRNYMINRHIIKPIEKGQ